MGEIRHGKIKMRPRLYFIIGSVLVFISLILASLSSVFLFGLIRFSLRTHGPMGQYRFEQLLSSFPWWAAILAILGLVIGVWLIRKYEFSYKINFVTLVIIFAAAIIIAGFLVDSIGINDIFSRQGCMNRLYGRNNCTHSIR